MDSLLFALVNSQDAMSRTTRSALPHAPVRDDPPARRADRVRARRLRASLADALHATARAVAPPAERPTACEPA